MESRTDQLITESKNMDDKAELKVFIDSIRRSLTDASEKADKIMSAQGFEEEDEAYYLWLEALADVTNNLMSQRLKGEVIEHLIFFSQQLQRASKVIKNCIDTSYVEHLMWNLDPEDKKWALSLFPENLKAMYTAMWGSV